MKKNSSVFVVVLCLICSLVFTGCGQSNSVPEPTVTPTATPTPTPKVIDYEALAAQMNGDIISPIEEAQAKLEEAEAKSEISSENNSDVSSVDTDTEPDTIPEDIDVEKVHNAVISAGIFEAGEDCIIYRFWSAGINRELIDLLGSDGTETSAAVYSELLNTFVANYDALQKAVALYEPDAVLVLHVVENGESTDPIIIVEDSEITYDYATEQRYFVSEEAGVVEDAPAEEAAG